MENEPLRGIIRGINKALVMTLLAGALMNTSCYRYDDSQIKQSIAQLEQELNELKAQLQGEISKYRPADKIKVTLVRDNKRRNVEVTLRNSQGDTSLAKAGDFSELGCAFRELKADQRQQLGISGGVEVAGVDNGGKFHEAGIKKGFIILSINNTRVASSDDVEKIYKSVMNGSESDRVLFISGIYPTGRKVYYAVNL